MSAAPEQSPTIPKPPLAQLKFFNARGMTFRAMQKQAQSSELYLRGDMRLIWVSEGDLLNLQMSGAAKEVS